MIKFWSIFLLFSWQLAAEEVCVPGGLSPDAKLEIVVTDEVTHPDVPYDHEFVLRDCVTRKTILWVSGGGYAHSLKQEIDSASLEHPNCSALWNPDSTAFAFNIRDSKRARSTFVFMLRNGVFEQVRHEELLPLIVKELGVSGVNRCCFQDPLRWESGTSLVLRVSGDCILPQVLQNEAGRWFEYEARLDLTQAKSLSIKRVALKDHNG